MPYLTTPDKCKLYYSTANFEADRPVLVLLNGTSQTTIYWEPHAAAFAKRYRVLRYDARAQGKSEIGKRSVSAEIHVSDLTHLIEHLKVARAHLIGISHGAYIALRLAATAPERVSRLVLCSIGNDSQAYIKQITRAWHQILQHSDLKTMAWAMLPLVFGKRFLRQNRDIVDKIVAAIAARNDKAALLTHLKAISAYPSPETYGRSIQCPTLVISGSDDPIVSRPDARQLAEDCRGRYEMFPQTGHSIPAEAPALFQQVILDFLNQP
ncbi:MAG: alpha/beta hydrolase [Desulfobacterales bacterium]